MKLGGVVGVAVPTMVVGVVVGGRGVAVAVLVGVLVGVDVLVGVAVLVDVLVAVGTSVGVLVAVGTSVGVLVAVGTSVGVLVAVGTSVGVLVAVGTSVGVLVANGVSVGVVLDVAVGESIALVAVAAVVGNGVISLEFFKASGKNVQSLTTQSGSFKNPVVRAMLKPTLASSSVRLIEINIHRRRCIHIPPYRLGGAGWVSGSGRLEPQSARRHTKAKSMKITKKNEAIGCGLLAFGFEVIVIPNIVR